MSDNVALATPRSRGRSRETGETDREVWGSVRCCEQITRSAGATRRAPVQRRSGPPLTSCPFRLPRGAGARQRLWHASHPVISMRPPVGSKPAGSSRPMNVPGSLPMPAPAANRRLRLSGSRTAPNVSSEERSPRQPQADPEDAAVPRATPPDEAARRKWQSACLAIVLPRENESRIAVIARRA